MPARSKLAKLRKNKTAGFAMFLGTFVVFSAVGIDRIGAGAETLLAAGMKFGAIGE